jgi:hypothetical protein
MSFSKWQFTTPHSKRIEYFVENFVTLDTLPQTIISVPFEINSAAIVHFYIIWSNMADGERWAWIYTFSWYRQLWWAISAWVMQSDIIENIAPNPQIKRLVVWNNINIIVDSGTVQTIKWTLTWFSLHTIE